MSSEAMQQTETKRETQNELLKSKVSPKTVNINELIARVKKERVKEKKESYVFIGLACGLLIITGIVASF